MLWVSSCTTGRGLRSAGEQELGSLTPRHITAGSRVASALSTGQRGLKGSGRLQGVRQANSGVGRVFREGGQVTDRTIPTSLLKGPQVHRRTAELSPKRNHVRCLEGKVTGWTCEGIQDSPTSCPFLDCHATLHVTAGSLVSDVAGVNDMNCKPLVRVRETETTFQSISGIHIRPALSGCLCPCSSSSKQLSKNPQITTNANTCVNTYQKLSAPGELENRQLGYLCICAFAYLCICAFSILLWFHNCSLRIRNKSMGSQSKSGDL